MAATINVLSVVSQQPGLLASDMDGEKVMLSISDGKYYNLGAIGGRIWELIETPCTIQELKAQLMQEYGVAESDCEEDLSEFLNQLLSEKLITVEPAEG
ncbi:lasso peptide biosynthesis PqqD family chaperone [Paenibacillus herberti]|uniref:PqqD family protein n=1 Tax=Paenibacillus herberti TaxID=1619309 RepID=A0A229NV50_9BACL|nr:lasso peptide biosynthesis PqqD family chaperone [Paenibacillus herberti]OXM13710.1 PqqD family protein [Paenibacillus herberti]